MNKEFPWLDEKGQPLSDEKLKEVSKNWSANTWEQYLKTQERSCREAILDDHLFDDLAEKNQISEIFQNQVTECPHKKLQEKITDAIDSLNHNQKTVILGLFYFNASLRELAKELSISKTAIEKTRDRAFVNLKRFLKNKASNKCKNVHQVSTVDRGVDVLPLSEGIKKLILKLEGGNSESKLPAAN